MNGEDAMPAADRTSVVHGSSVSVNERAALIIGASGSGKSRLALELMAMGAHLVSDDRTVVSRHGKSLIATAPPTIIGLIEARGVGILKIPQSNVNSRAEIALVVDLDREEHDRMPPARTIGFVGILRPRYYLGGHPFAASCVRQLLIGGVARDL